MAVYFVETSALAKRYVAETGSVWLRTMLDPRTGCSIYVVRVTAVEMIAALTRRGASRHHVPGRRYGVQCRRQCRRHHD